MRPKKKLANFNHRVDKSCWDFDEIHGGRNCPIFLLFLELFYTNIYQTNITSEINSGSSYKNMYADSKSRIWTQSTLLSFKIFFFFFWRMNELHILWNSLFCVCVFCAHVFYCDVSFVVGKCVFDAGIMQTTYTFSARFFNKSDRWRQEQCAKYPATK
jgi:hypothetical protein